MNPPAIDDSEAWAMMKAALAAHDDRCVLWPKESVEYAQSQYRKHQGRIPTIEEVAYQIGAQKAARLADEVVRWRAFDNQLKGYRCPCHYCGSVDDLVHWDFALMRVADSKRSWGETIGTAAVSAITLPLLGVGAVRLPGSSLEGQALHLRLVVCKPCCRKEGNMLGLFMLNEKRASKHPLWQPLHDAGFTKFLDGEKMPDSFRYTPSRNL
jgi:hypothetical protein